MQPTRFCTILLHVDVLHHLPDLPVSLSSHRAVVESLNLSFLVFSVLSFLSHCCSFNCLPQPTLSPPCLDLLTLPHCSGPCLEITDFRMFSDSRPGFLRGRPASWVYCSVAARSTWCRDCDPSPLSLGSTALIYSFVLLGPPFMILFSCTLTYLVLISPC